MEDVEFSDEFCRFIQAAIPAVDAAELLLLLHDRKESAFTAEEAVAKLGPGVTLGEVQKHLERFQEKGLAKRIDRRYQYRPESELARFVETLAQAYVRRPVTLIRVIYALRDSKIQTFADAFKIRRS
ncbi:MAG TPA: hypothetical protein VK043_02190 [Burkholderiales bacterium]|nr:hypothetical protein [Burkholderiales bacterium]